MKRGLLLAGIAGAILGMGSRGGRAQDLDCPEFWIPPGGTQPQCLEIFRSEPSPPDPASSPEAGDAPETGASEPLPPSPPVPSEEATAETDPDDAAASGNETGSETTTAEPEWMFVIQRQDGLRFFFDPASVTAVEGDSDRRTFTFRQDASQARAILFDFLERDRMTTVSCSQNTFTHGTTIVRDRDGSAREFTSSSRGVASDDADPGFFAVLQAVCATDLMVEEPEAPAEPAEESPQPAASEEDAVDPGTESEQS